MKVSGNAIASGESSEPKLKLHQREVHELLDQLDRSGARLHELLQALYKQLEPVLYLQNGAIIKSCSDLEAKTVIGQRVLNAAESAEAAADVVSDLLNRLEI